MPHLLLVRTLKYEKEARDCSANLATSLPNVNSSQCGQRGEEDFQAYGGPNAEDPKALIGLSVLRHDERQKTLILLISLATSEKRARGALLPGARSFHSDQRAPRGVAGAPRTLARRR